MKLLGRRVLLTLPQRPDSVLELTAEVEKQLEMDFIKRWTGLEVYAVGEEVTTVVPGDKVYVPSSTLTNAERIIIDDETKMMINDFEIAIIWDEKLNAEKRRDINVSKLDRKYTGKEIEIEKEDGK